MVRYPVIQRSEDEQLVMLPETAVKVQCNVCGKASRMYVAANSSLRETCTCASCGSFNRQRQIADVILKRVRELTEIPARSMADLSRLNWRIYHTESSRALHDYLSQSPNYTCSEYFGCEYQSGELVNGVLNQDLQRTSFQDEAFDLVVSSDVFEHIADPYEAHREVYRILRVGGRHVFTVPFSPIAYLDDVRARIEDGKEVHYKDPIYHLDPLRSSGAIVYTIFSLEMLIKLAQIGFKTIWHQIDKPFQAIGGRDAFVFEAIKSDPISEVHND